MDGVRQLLRHQEERRLLMRARSQRGFTLVEILISITVLALLMMIGIPSFSVFIQNSRTRAAADATLNGLQITRNEAIRRNQCVQLKLVNQTGWAISTCADPDTVLQTRSASEGTYNVVATVTPGDSDTISFNGLGRVVAPNPSDGSAPFTQVQVNNSTLSTADDRKLRIVIPAGGSIRMCDPAVASTDTRFCDP
jgi:type IV fimbrial biogenesis protein FimT